MSRGLVLEKGASNAARNAARAVGKANQKVPRDGQVEVRLVGTPAKVIAAELAIHQVLEVVSSSRDYPSKHDSRHVVRFVAVKPKDKEAP